MNANADGSDSVLTDRSGVLSNDFFVNLLDMNTAWGPSSEAYVFEGRDRRHDLKWTATEFDLVFGSNSELRAVVEFYAFDESRQRFIRLRERLDQLWMRIALISKIQATWL